MPRHSGGRVASRLVGNSKEVFTAKKKKKKLVSNMGKIEKSHELNPI